MRRQEATGEAAVTGGRQVRTEQSVVRIINIDSHPLRASSNTATGNFTECASKDGGSALRSPRYSHFSLIKNMHEKGREREREFSSKNN